MAIDSAYQRRRSLTAFNARTMSAIQVAESFVAPDSFQDLIKPDHSLLSGPRGSGKTTLLKMLQPAALEAWRGPVAEAVREAVSYSGVFVATDRTWKKQLLLATPAQQDTLEAIADAAFTTHVVRELVSTMAFRAHTSSPEIAFPPTRVSLSPSQELALVRNFARLLSLEVETPRLESVADSLTLRLSELGSLRTDVREGRAFTLPKWLSQDCLAVSEACIDLFNRAAHDSEHQWAFLFDEMELAPPRIVEALLDATRGSQAVMLYKLSLSPVQPELARLHLPGAGVHGQDFELIRLTYPGQHDALKFARDLAAAEIRSRYGDSPDVPAIDRLLGPSVFNDSESVEPIDVDSGPGRSRSDPYAVGSSLWRRFESLRDIDSSFAEWLHRQNVDLEHLDRLTANERAAKIRKVRNLVVVRQFFRAQSGRRSRKSRSLYTGADSMLAIVDGNPRMLKALMGRLLPNEIPPRLPLKVTAQSEALDSIIGRFLSLIRSLDAVDLPSGRTLQVIELIDVIGQTLSDAVIDRPFDSNVATSFKVDAKLPSHLVAALQLALNAGAIVHVPREPGENVPVDLAGEEFRLSHLLAPYYSLPLRLGESRSLRSLLQRTDGRRWLYDSNRGRSRSADRSQQVLFDSSSSVEEKER